MERSSFLFAAFLVGTGTAAAQTLLPPAAPIRTAVTESPSFRPSSPAPPEMPVNEKLVQFDPLHAQLSWQEESWRIVADGAVVKDFGRQAADARQALELIQTLRLNQHGTIGDPTTVMEYWLSNGRAPIGIASGTHRLAIDTASLSAALNQGQWVVRDRQRVWFNFGQRADEARQAVAVMRKYDFTQVAPLGRPAPTMTVFLANPTKPGSGAAHFQGPTTPSPDAVAALGGYVAPTLPPLRNATRQPNQPLQPFARSQAQETTALQQVTFRPGPAATPLNLSERVIFDYRQAQVREEKGHWKLATGSHVIADFGPNVLAAKQALRAVQYYRFTEQCTVGQPTPYCSYFLVNGQAPRGIVFGATVVPISPQALAVEKVGNRYVVASANKPVLTFGDRPDEAEHMLEVMRRQKFDHLVHVGGPEDEGLTFMVKAR